MIALMLLLMGCTPSDQPAWALDSLWIEPTAEGVHGFHTWELFGPGWEGGLEPRHYLCAVVVEVEGVLVGAEDCQGCEPAWSVQGTLLESDCEPPWSQDPRWTEARGVALGPLGADLVEDDPHPGTSVGGHVDYGDGWMPHGWAWSDTQEPAGEWDGSVPFVLWPAWAWPL